jgi:RNA polymerase sigma factor (sigma-70 family)
VRPGALEWEVIHVPEPLRTGDDRELFATLLGKALREKDDDALTSLVSLLGTRRYVRQIKAYLSVIPGAHSSTRDDVVQETFLRFMDRVRSGELTEVPADVLKYVARLAAFYLRDRLRYKLHEDERERGSLTSVKHTAVDPNAVGPVTECDLREHRKFLDAALAELPAEDREILLLSQGDLSYREIGDQVGKSEEAVRKVVKRSEARVLEKLIQKSPTLASQYREQTRAPERPAPRAEELRKAVGTLPPELRTVVSALHYDGKSIDDLASSLGRDKAEARRDAGYEMLSMQFGGLPFPETLERGTG